MNADERGLIHEAGVAEQEDGQAFCCRGSGAGVVEGKGAGAHCRFVD